MYGHQVMMISAIGAAMGAVRSTRDTGPENPHVTRAVEALKKLRTRHNDPEIAKFFSDLNRAKKLVQMLKRNEPISEAAGKFLEEFSESLQEKIQEKVG